MLNMDTNKVAGLILENTITSILDMARVLLPFLKWFIGSSSSNGPKVLNSLVRFPWSTIDVIGQIKQPILFLSGLQDEMVPPPHICGEVSRFRAEESVRKEVGQGEGGDHSLLVIVGHAILIESGFVGFDSVSRRKVEGFHLPDEWPSLQFTMSLQYTLPEIIKQGPITINGVETMKLKFQSLGKFVNVYGSLAKNGSGPYGVHLDEDHLVFFLNLIWANCDSIDEMNGKDSFFNLQVAREVFEFWKTVKDKLTLPLLIDLCERAGLAPPPCFMHLTTDLKLKIWSLFVVLMLLMWDLFVLNCVICHLMMIYGSVSLWSSLATRRDLREGATKKKSIRSIGRLERGRKLGWRGSV
ncbi:Alpha/beta hydrolase domain-containing protein WAV2 [Camellia lanceoleosa]|uniref:Alpha/beta hydrolase domain-containing protein WAV2 n=1 Tax=Camellia lanceoleosa TaxID=1840588 RepID=A0ACC0FVL6_9ERIC|nr:Alpha/beta hydrolase domain-containing protein WAV2 [Camellia lanceoleosa]